MEGKDLHKHEKCVHVILMRFNKDKSKFPGLGKYLVLNTSWEMKELRATLLRNTWGMRR